MPQIQEETKEELKLTCREAGLLIRHIHLDKPWKNYSPEEQTAMRHPLTYGGWTTESYCECKEKGFIGVYGESPSCKEALESWAKNPGPIYLVGSNNLTLKDVLGVEHVWGRWERSEFGKGYNSHIGSCENKPCTALMNYWQSTPFSSQYDGEAETANEIPFIIELFIKNSLPLDNMFQIQSERMKELLNSIRVVTGNHDLGDVVSEISHNLDFLQELAKK